MTMRARVLEVNQNSLLVFDTYYRRQVIVHTPNASDFCVGDHVLILYSGAMTMSIPPQISAIGITKVLPRRNNCC